MLNSLKEFFERDLEKLKEEISLYKNENDLWKIDGEIKNSAGNLCMHLTGNLQHFIGAVLGKNGYVRNRDAEFASKNISRNKLIEEIDTTIAVINKSLNQLKESDMQKNYPVEKHGKIVTMDNMLLHLLSHFNYHLGQVNYHRRLIVE